MDNPYDMEINELSVNEGAFWHINMDLYYGYQVGEIVEVEHEPNKYWLASICYSYKHLVLLRWVGSQEEFWVDTSSSNFPQNSSSFNLEHAQPRRLYPLGYHSQFHTRSQFDLVRPTKFLEKPTLYNPACDPYGSIRTVEDLLAHDTEINDQNCVLRNTGKMNDSESMDLVMANRRAKVAFGQEDAEELEAALQNLDAIDATNSGDQDQVQNSITIPTNHVDKNEPCFKDSNGKSDICPDALDSGISNGLNDSKSNDEVTAQPDHEASKDKNKREVSDVSQESCDEELIELCKNLIQSATTSRKYNGIGENSSKVYQVKPKQLYDVGGANHERVFVPGTLLEVCHIKEDGNHLRLSQWFAVVLRNTGGRLTLRWFICDEPKFRQGRLDLKSARSEFIRDNNDQELVEDEEYLDAKKLPADSITFSKHFCHPSILTVASTHNDSQRSYLMPPQLRKFIESIKGRSQAESIQSKLIDVVHDERRKSLDKDRPTIDHILDTAQNLGPKYLKLDLIQCNNAKRHEVLISSPTSTRLLRGFVASVLRPGIYEIHSEPLSESSEIVKFVYPYDSSYTVLPISWGTLNEDCLSIATSRVTSPPSSKKDHEADEALQEEILSSCNSDQFNHFPIEDQSKLSQATPIDFEVAESIHFINDGVTNWCTKSPDCDYCCRFSNQSEFTSQEEFKCELDESSKNMVIEEFKIMDRLEVAHPSSNITICSGRIRKVVYPLLWIQISPESYTLLPFNSTEIYPYRWSEFHGHSSISLLPMLKRNNRQEDKKRKRQRMSDDSDCEQSNNGVQYRGDQDFDTTLDLGKLSDKPIDIDYILNEKSQYITIYFNHKCFTGPALSKGKICSLPQYVGPGPLRLVMEEVITKVISVAYVPPRILNDLSSRTFEELLISRKMTNTTPIEFKAKYQKRVHRELVQVCVDVNDVALYCECVCEHLKCCYNLFSPELYDGDDCPGHCRVLTKSNKFMKRATYYREKARLGEFTIDNSKKKAAANNNQSDKTSRPRYVGRGSSESTNSSLSRNEQPNSRASSDDIEDEGITDYKENVIAEDLNGEEEEVTKIATDLGSCDNHNPMATEQIENNQVDDKIDKCVVTPKATVDDAPVERPVQPQTKSITEQLFDEFDGLAIDSDLINRWTINDLREYLKSGRMDKFVPIVMTEHIDGEALLLLDDSAIRELFQQHFTKEFTREDVDRFCHFVEYVKFRAKTESVQTVC